jgi:hypothetical protein
MRKLGLRGVRRGGYKKPRTTVPDPAQQRPADLVNRDFAPDAPHRPWVVDFTFVATWAQAVGGPGLTPGSACFRLVQREWEGSGMHLRDLWARRPAIASEDVYLAPRCCIPCQSVSSGTQTCLARRCCCDHELGHK